MSKVEGRLGIHGTRHGSGALSDIGLYRLARSCAMTACLLPLNRADPHCGEYQPRFSRFSLLSMRHATHRSKGPATGPFRFPVSLAQRMETPRQHMRRLQAESNRSIRALATRLDCLGWFDPWPDGPRAA